MFARSRYPTLIESITGRTRYNAGQCAYWGIELARPFGEGYDAFQDPG
jgi:hypothetical protein